MSFNYWIYIGIGSGLISIGVALYLFFWVKRQDAGSEKAKEVASWIREGATSYLKRLYSALTLVAAILGFVIALVFSFINTKSGAPEFGAGAEMALAFVFGALCSAVAGYMGMSVAVEANVRTATAANHSLNQAFRLSFYGGSVMGLAMVGLAVIGMSIIYSLTGSPQFVLGFSVGALIPGIVSQGRRRDLHQDCRHCGRPGG